MVLKENIEKLNEKYRSYGLKFEYQEDINRIIINENFVISNDIALKNELKTSYSISFDWDNKYWYIGETGINFLKQKKVKTAPSKGIDYLKAKLLEFIQMIKEKRIKEALKAILNNHPEFYTAPGAAYHHHNYRGGLLEHTVQTCKIALAIANDINDEIVIDMDLLIIGSILHDIGKINCYKLEESKISITKILIEQDHIVNGIKIISQELKIDRLDDIIHIIASHHNIKDWGSPIEPSSNEAWVIHFSENLSSKILG